MSSRLFRVLLGCALAFPIPAMAQGLFHEVRGGVLAHDIPIWAAGHVERGVSINAEVAFTPSLSVLGGVIRPALGASVSTENGTSLGPVLN